VELRRITGKAGVVQDADGPQRNDRTQLFMKRPESQRDWCNRG
jgi:hypothetical protein